MEFGIVDSRFLSKSIGLINPPTPIILEEQASVMSAIRLLKDNKIGCVIVVNPIGEISGIFSERDVILRVVLENLDYENTPLVKVMTANPQTTQMTCSIAFVLNMMSQGGYRHVPIVDKDNKPVGIASVKNIVDFISFSLSKDLVSFRS
ncbi:MAG: CBS domain-containing protein [Deltaproteobacteria bacterium]|nr:CBS domain-containing protein [Deltaproteobacteria bacterium]